MSVSTLTSIDPIASYSYHIEIGGVTFAQFQKVDGLSIEINAIEWRENKLKAMPIMRKLPGHVKFADIQLSRGKVGDHEFFNWIQQVQDGKISEARKHGSIVLFDYAHGELQRFNFENGWPSKVSIGSLSSNGNEVLLENMTIVHERLTIG